MDAVRLARTFTDDVQFSAEDATRSDPEFLWHVVEAVIQSGAKTINLPDTVGYSTPDEIQSFFARLIDRVPSSDQVIWSTHCHDDLGLAVANTLAALDRRRAPGRVHHQRDRRARRQRVARGSRHGDAGARRPAAVRERHRHASRSSPPASC